MIKLVALVRRKAGMSFDDFVRYYEDVHVPLISGYMRQLVDYRRNYAIAGSDSGHERGEEGSAPAYDAIMEAWFENEEQFEATRAVLSDPVVSATIAADEEKFCDRGSLSMFLVDERISDCLRPVG